MTAKFVVYVSNEGVPTLHEYQVVNPSGMSPQVGCDILIQDAYGAVNSAKSKGYSDTAKEAIARKLDSERDGLVLWQGKADAARNAVTSMELMLKQLPA